jgi:fumarylacetoacetase
MIVAPDRTHDPAAHSWVASARRPGTDFPIQNLPFGVFRRRPGAGSPRIGVAIGDEVLDLARLESLGGLAGLDPEVAAAARGRTLNALMSLPGEARAALRGRLFDLLAAGTSAPATAADSLIAGPDVELLLPAEIGDYTDFYASIHHAANVGALFRPDSPLLPNYKFVPIGYHGRASSIVVSGTPVRRPRGQIRDDPARPPALEPTRALDYECEMGAFVARGNPLGVPIPLGHAEEHLFGLCLLNDWSARDVQRWEYQPLGPFLAKSFATTVSPWVVTIEALAPFRVPAFDRPPGDPEPLPYLTDETNRRTGGIGLVVVALLATARMRREGVPPASLSTASVADLYWTLGQLVTHHASGGCNLRPGDLLGTGTISGPAPHHRGCLLELTSGGTQPISLPTGETRRYLEDGDEVILRGRCERPGFVPIGFGECRGTIAAGE